MELSCIAKTQDHEVRDFVAVLWLIKRHDETKECPKCHKRFPDGFVKHWCRICKNFFCTSDMKIEWLYENKDSAEADGKKSMVNVWNVGKKCKNMSGILN